MGCDIHFFVEHHEHDRWTAVPMPVAYLKDMDRGGIYLHSYNTAMAEVETDPGYFQYKTYSWEMWRNYRLFDALNGVRCPGIDSSIGPDGRYRWDYENDGQHVHDVIGQLREPGVHEAFGHHIGWPEDIDEEVTRHQIWDDDGHSYCWGLLDELQDERIAQCGGGHYVTLMRHMAQIDPNPRLVRGLWFYDN